ncbi:MAG TPA: F-box protein [Candidatus Saccharimonadales bacterium]|nr:F-box protein [Candidatus Saccharimonadales bacterium]
MDDVYQHILLNLPLDDFQHICQTSKHIKTICDTNIFLKQKRDNARKDVEAFLDDLMDDDVYISPSQDDIYFSIYHHIIKNIGIKQEPFEIDMGEWDEHPADAHNANYVYEIYFETLNTDLYRITFKTYFTYLRFNRDEFYANKNQLDAFLYHLYYDGLVEL